MDRRSFLTGATALAAFALLRGRATVLLAATPDREVAVGNTFFSISDSRFADSTNNSLNSRKLCFAPTGSGIGALELAYLGFGFDHTEADLPGGYTVSASVEYPLGSTPRRVLFGGQPTVAVPPGAVMRRSDPLPVSIPAGARFAVKTHATWQAPPFWLSIWSASHLIGEWTARGIDVPDHTLDNETLRTTNGVEGFGPIVYGTLERPTPVVGMVGDSLGVITGDWPDPSIGHNGWGRAMRGVLPFINLSKGAGNFHGYFRRETGRTMILHDAVTHVIMELGGNDLFGGAPVEVVSNDLQTATAPFLGAGVHCFAVTFTPRSHSTDGWISTQNQRLLTPQSEPARRAYNDWLRTHWRGLGLAGVFDIAHALDPHDSGLWSFDEGTAAAPRNAAAGFATVAGGRVNEVATAHYNNGVSAGEGYQPGSRLACVVQTYPGTPGGGAAVHAEIGAGGQVDRFVVDAPGAGYSYPPMVGLPGPWTRDGGHPNARGFNEMIVRAGIGPQAFAL